MPHQAAPQAGGHMHGQMYGQPQASGVQSTNNPNLLHDSSRIQDKEHMSHHFGGVLSEPDLSKMSEEELQFYYFKMHDNDNNNKLDGSELIKSLIHWHVEESKQLGQPKGTTKLFTDAELVQMIDPILEMDDRNGDGYIDYPEFIAAQKHRRML
ncbi:multiple coagulation factor deficiency protein 2-like protein [Dinothrombium tinctorium]|nr:multiple coagulation factor deficiency protein 2-like protein [Dinothrombium tinctorium]